MKKKPLDISKSTENYQEFDDETEEETQIDHKSTNSSQWEMNTKKKEDVDTRTFLVQKPKRSFCEGVCQKLFKFVSKRGRQIFNDGKIYPRNFTSNKINNCKYNLFLLLPFFLFDQYKYFGNLYFLLLAITQFFDSLKVGFMITYIGPIIIILGFSLAKELWDHFNTWKKDEEYNNEQFMVLRKGRWIKLSSANIKVGDLVKLGKKQRVPADMVFLGQLPRRSTKSKEFFSSMGNLPMDKNNNSQNEAKKHQASFGLEAEQEQLNMGTEISLNQTEIDIDGENLNNSACTFVMTDQLDGETDLKPRESLQFTHQTLQSNGGAYLRSLKWKLTLEPPNEQIYQFQGMLEHEGSKEVIKLKNTFWMGMRVVGRDMVGLVVFAGNESKLALNSRKKSSKFGKTDLEIDKLIVALFLILLVISVIITVLAGQIYEWDGLIYGLRVLILLSSIIPISMRIMVDFAKIYYCIEISKDKGIPNAITRNSSLPEELARIEYLLSDKTGTLTRNEMIFRKIITRKLKLSSEHFQEIKKILRDKPGQKQSEEKSEDISHLDEHKNNTSCFLEGSQDGSDNLDLKKSQPFDSKLNIFSQFEEIESEFEMRASKNPYKIQTTENTGVRDYIEKRVFGFLLCNNVKVVRDEEGNSNLQGASPDEISIVKFVQDLGYEIVSRSQGHITVRDLQGNDIRYSILQEFSFSSEKKRMGMAFSRTVKPTSGNNHDSYGAEGSSGEVLFILKGADSVMGPLMSNSEDTQFIEEATEELAKEGYRTLVFGSKRMTREGFNIWKERMVAAENAEMQRILEGKPALSTLEKNNDNNSSKQNDFSRNSGYSYGDSFASNSSGLWSKPSGDLTPEQVRHELERGLDFLCITGVEDLLRDDVKSSIMNFREAGIKVWMLTGDKLETAKCVSICTGFKSEMQEFLHIKGTDSDSINSQLDRLEVPQMENSKSVSQSKNAFQTNFKEFQINPTGFNDPENFTNSPNIRMKAPVEFFEEQISIMDKCLLISGETLGVILKEKGLTDKFLLKAPIANSVVLCRCAPKQKSSIALLLKKRLKKVICCVGDGGNDVGMIQSSSLGIGIEGKEGRQAALASDVSVVEFGHVQKLFFWHGRLSYMRSAKICNFVVHRGIIVTVIQALFILIYYFVSISIYNGLTLLGYSTIFTTFPIFMLILDKDLPREQALNYPILYGYLQQGKYLNPRVFLTWLYQSIYQGMCVLLTAVLFYHNLSFSKIVTTTFVALLMIGNILWLTSITC